MHEVDVAVCRFIGFPRGITRQADAAGKTQAEGSWLVVSLLVGVVVFGSFPLQQDQTMRNSWDEF